MLEFIIQDMSRVFATLAEETRTALQATEVGYVVAVGSGIARVEGLPSVKSQELLLFHGGVPGIAFNIDPYEIGVILLGECANIAAGTKVYCTGRVVDIPVGDALLGRVISATGAPLDGESGIEAVERLPVEQESPSIMDRAPVVTPLETGIKVIDALVPIGKGQRELILGDRQTGKTAIALDTIINQQGKNVLCVYCAIGQRGSAVAQLIASLRRHGAMAYTVVLVAGGDESPGLQFIAPYAATSIAEYFMRQGRDVLVVYDDLTRHARAYRELSLLLRRPPGREAYPGDIFYIHSRLLERSTHLRPELGGGSLTAIPILETQAQNLADYIPTNLISITDGQIYLSPDFFQKGVLPAVDVGKSVSRVGGKTQLPAYRAITGDLRLAYAQFEELESFARFSTRLDHETLMTIERGRRIREVLKQPQYTPLTTTEQIIILLAATEGYLDNLELQEIADAEERLQQAVLNELPDLEQQIFDGKVLGDGDRQLLAESIQRVVQTYRG
ncbi:alternate F1F0 ATPase, F1 subunit alpha [Desulfobulbus propionicus DSM 2032]|uniref:ATP synthase subunit alpha n=1 Tax=Desulfobulbus propionicus (strain ATCC 33891 / DSM 2032 / VKM B-1956 / 1pr3) TaxID=577650 RepID=A0A7U3YL82_DESPD|nr:alternate F1F0 ATPase, F1 subunit alpha [Desulfobulbus propionicus]ADW17434.1 alternate F1F0 ATPase, F1 subunit alpha [Desulfobulbus propionicus DSM 2032]